MKELWMRFLTAKTEEDLEMLTKGSPIMASAVDRLVYASGTKELRKQMDDYERNEMKNLLTRKYDKKEGRMEGEYKKAVEIAKKALGQGLSADVVAQITGLPVDDVLRLA
jgi:MoaA/NifB/PqqE/SkfB family radical SAM enzyme